MSYERQHSPETTDDEVDGSAPTERKPVLAQAQAPSHGAALSVLWWRDVPIDDEEPQKPETD